VRFDHDFIGREALEKKSKEPHRKKVTFCLERRRLRQDLRRRCSCRAPTITSSSTYPSPTTHRPRMTKVMMGGKVVGFSMFWRLQLQRTFGAVTGRRRSQHRCGATCSPWCGAKRGGGTNKTTVERHIQLDVRGESGAGALWPAMHVRDITKAGARGSPDRPLMPPAASSPAFSPAKDGSGALQRRTAAAWVEAGC